MRPSRATITVARRCLSSTRDAATAIRPIDAREWARQRPELARDALAVPPAPPLEFLLVHNEGLEGNNALPPPVSLESYLSWRGWDMPNSISPDEKDLAVSLVSHPLTFPLTLGKHMASLVNTCSEIDDDGHSPTSRSNSSATARLCCVGARAEAALPDEYWRELLYSSILSADTGGKSISSSASISIDFIGPDIAPHLQSKTVVLDADRSRPITRSLKMDFHRQYLHQYILEKYRGGEAKDKGNPTDGSATSEESFDPAYLLSLWDGFVLFNPGIGHPNLSKVWLPTLRYVLKTKRSVLFTAHSHLDSERDWSALKATMLDLGQEERLREIIATWHGSTGGDDEDENPYTSNPVASRIDYEDPFCDDGDEKNKSVRPNMFSFFLEKVIDAN